MQGHPRSGHPSSSNNYVLPLENGSYVSQSGVVRARIRLHSSEASFGQFYELDRLQWVITDEEDN
jgi:hypothetical protein